MYEPSRHRSENRGTRREIVVCSVPVGNSGSRGVGEKRETKAQTTKNNPKSHNPARGRELIFMSEFKTELRDVWKILQVRAATFRVDEPFFVVFILCFVYFLFMPAPVVNPLRTHIA